MKKVSVIVPCYNAAEYLDKCITHLLNQTIGMENIEIILVNDASTDGGDTWGLITEYEQKFPDTILAISLEQNLRQGGARNVGVSYATGEYFIFCDADDWLLEETLEHCYCAAEEYNADVVEFLGQNVRDRDIPVSLEKGGNSRLIELDTEEKRKKFLLLVNEEFSYGSQTKLYRLSLIRENNIVFAEHLIFEEPSFVVPVRLYEKRHYFLDERLYVWYLSQNSTVRSDWGEHKWDNPKVWMFLISSLQERGFMQIYNEELEFLFLVWGMGLSIRMIVQKGYVLMKEELQFLVNMILQIFPNIRENKYILNNNGQKGWYQLLVTLLNIEITDESIKVVNQVLRDFV
ncbi:MAG: glycosyltransferase family 2 protein [Lachnospiraceae bacterium]|nr:glycosyltransferase family 2 protein [Lachnospiraceae bacterium]